MRPPKLHPTAGLVGVGSGASTKHKDPLAPSTVSALAPASSSAGQFVVVLLYCCKMMVVLTTADPPMSKLGAPTPNTLPQSTTVEGCISPTLAMAPSLTTNPTANRTNTAPLIIRVLLILLSSDSPFGPPVGPARPDPARNVHCY